MANWARTQGQQQIQNPYQGFEPVAQGARQGYQKYTVPTLANRFTSMGSGNALSSPAFVNQLRAGGEDLESNLASMMAQYGQHQQALGQGLMGMGMHPQFENVYTAGGPSALSGLFGGLQSGLGSMAGAGFEKAYGNMLNKGSGNDLQSIIAKLSGSNPNQEAGRNYYNSGQMPAWAQIGLGRPSPYGYFQGGY